MKLIQILRPVPLESIKYTTVPYKVLHINQVRKCKQNLSWAPLRWVVFYIQVHNTGRKLTWMTGSLGSFLLSVEAAERRPPV
jgi:hypothetical protein